MRADGEKMFTRIRSKIDLKLGLALVFILSVAMAGILFANMAVLDRTLAAEEARTQLLRETNQSLRAEIFTLQKDYQAIPLKLEVNAVGAIKTWAESQGAARFEYNGRAEIKTRYKKRGQRRDLGKPGRFVVDDGKGAPAVAYGDFKDGAYTGKVVEYRFSSIALDNLQAEVERIVSENDGPAALARKVVSLKADLADAALEAENKRVSILSMVDEIKRKDDEVNAFTEQAKLFLIVLGVASILVVFAIVYSIGRILITRSLVRLQAGIRAVADGEDVTLKEDTRLDEIGSLARGINRFQEARDEAAALREQQERERLETQKAVENRLQTVAEQLETGMNSSVRNLTHFADDLVSMSDRLRGLASNTNDQAGEASELASENANAADEIMKMAQSLVAHGEEISQAVRRQRQLTELANREAQSAGRTVAQLHEAAAQVEGIVEIIQDIAGQTNLLALNATIEASRAGAAGSGFAVVAGEVKKLSQETAGATQNIAERVKTIRNVANQAAKGISAIEGRISTVEGSMGELATSFERQMSTSTGIAGHMETSLRNATRVSQSNAAMREAAQSTGSATGQLTDTSDSIKQAMGAMRDELTRILRTASQSQTLQAAE